MNTASNIVITGAAGFIASCMASFLNSKGYRNLYLVDDFSVERKKKNYQHIHCLALVEREDLSEFLSSTPGIDLVIHFGARTDTTEMDYDIHKNLNLLPSVLIWDHCSRNHIPLIYASSAATYGNGEFGYTDDHAGIAKLKPLNPYGVSKQEFDLYALEKEAEGNCPPNWYGLKFFNVYGPNEYHKGRMASVVFHAYKQIIEKGSMRLFRSHHPDYKDGEQKRDFIYVMDVLEVTWWLMHHLPASGLYNLGSGKAETFLQLAHAVFKALEKPVEIEFIDTPIDIRDKYQYFTEANMEKLRLAGYNKAFYSIDEGAGDYVSNYLSAQQYFGEKA